MRVIHALREFVDLEARRGAVPACALTRGSVRQTWTGEPCKTMDILRGFRLKGRRLVSHVGWVEPVW